MNVDTAPRTMLEGWVPILGAFSIWFAHFLVVYAAALIWPDLPLARLIAVIATIAAWGALAVLFARLRSAEPAGEQARFARRFGFGSIFIAATGTLFDALPALMG